MAKLVILTLEYREAKALAAKLNGQPVNANEEAYKEGYRKLMQGLVTANPLEQRKGTEPKA